MLANMYNFNIDTLRHYFIKDMKIAFDELANHPWIGLIGFFVLWCIFVSAAKNYPSKNFFGIFVLTIYMTLVWTLVLMPLVVPFSHSVNFDDYLYQVFNHIKLDVFLNGFTRQDLQNILLFVPIPFLLKWAYHARIGQIVAWCIMATCLIETIQVTAGFSVLGYPTRFFDVKDLLTNFGGALISILILEILAPIFNDHSND